MAQDETGKKLAKPIPRTLRERAVFVLTDDGAWEFLRAADSNWDRCARPRGQARGWRHGAAGCGPRATAVRRGHGAPSRIAEVFVPAAVRGARSGHVVSHVSAVTAHPEWPVRRAAATSWSTKRRRARPREPAATAAGACLAPRLVRTHRALAGEAWGAARRCGAACAGRSAVRWAHRCCCQGCRAARAGASRRCARSARMLQTQLHGHTVPAPPAAHHPARLRKPQHAGPAGQCARTAGPARPRSRPAGSAQL